MFFEFLVLGAEVFYAFLEFFGFTGEGPGEVVELAEASGGEVVGVLAGDGFDAAGAGGDGGLGGDFEVADFSGGLDVGAAAEFLAPAAEVHDADDVSVFIAEEGDDVVGFFGVGDFVGLNGFVV